MSLELVIEVLVVDDSPVDRSLVKKVLERQTYLTCGTAENGSLAMEMISEQRPDLIITDLQMPRMDGLELVRAIRAGYPGLPVILMTAHGSEEIAVQALKDGAASYVPKSRLSLDLLPTVEQVLSRAQQRFERERLLECIVRRDTSFELENDPALVHSLIEHLQAELRRISFTDAAGILQIGSALEAALLNSLYHGNLEIDHSCHGDELTALAGRRRSESPYKDRKIFVTAKYSPKEACFVIRDEGRGFEHENRTRSTVGGLVGDCGRGISLMQAMMDEVKYNKEGNEVAMAIRRK